MALTTSSNFNIENVTFSGIEQAARYDLQRISIYYLDEQNDRLDLHVEVPNVISYGIQTNNFKNSSVDSYTLPLVMDGEATNKLFAQILDKSKEHLNIPAIKKVFAKKEFSIEEMDTFYRKQGSPTLYAKLDKISAKFYNNETEESIDPKTLMNQRCRVKVYIHVREICIAKKPTIQFYVSKAFVIKRLDSNPPSTWRRQESTRDETRLLK